MNTIEPVGAGASIRRSDEARPVQMNAANALSFMQAGRIGKLVLKNRLVRAATSETMATDDGAATDELINLYSDLIVHHMGPGLADGLPQGQAGPDEFRTAPLWGIGQRLWFLHDGRTANIVTAIEDHYSVANTSYVQSEANQTVVNFNNLTKTNQQDLVDFLRSL